MGATGRSSGGRRSATARCRSCFAGRARCSTATSRTAARACSTSSCPSRGWSACAGWLRRAREILHARAIEAPALTDVAAEVGVAPLRLARAFRRTYGESPGDFVRRERIRLACDRLARPGTTLAAIAAELGFTDQSHFTRVFRKQVGTTPGAWRRDNAPRRGH